MRRDGTLGSRAGCNDASLAAPGSTAWRSRTGGASPWTPRSPRPWDLPRSSPPPRCRLARIRRAAAWPARRAAGRKDEGARASQGPRPCSFALASGNNSPCARSLSPVLTRRHRGCQQQALCQLAPPPAIASPLTPRPLPSAGSVRLRPSPATGPGLQGCCPPPRPLLTAAARSTPAASLPGAHPFKLGQHAPVAARQEHDGQQADCEEAAAGWGGWVAALGRFRRHLSHASWNGQRWVQSCRQLAWEGGTRRQARGGDVRMSWRGRRRHTRLRGCCCCSGARPKARRFKQRAAGARQLALGAHSMLLGGSVQAGSSTQQGGRLPPLTLAPSAST